MNKKWDDIDVICPNCGEAYSHILKIDIYPSDEDEPEYSNKAGLSTIEVTHYGKIELKPYKEIQSRSRGLSYRVSFACEGCHCVWCEESLFHKGGMFRTVSVDKILSYDEFCAALDRENPKR